MIVSPVSGEELYKSGRWDDPCIRATIRLYRPDHRVAKIKDAGRPTGEWNKVEVMVNNGGITYLVNR